MGPKCATLIQPAGNTQYFREGWAFLLPSQPSIKRHAVFDALTCSQSNLREKRRYMIVVGLTAERFNPLTKKQAQDRCFPRSTAWYSNRLNVYRYLNVQQMRTHGPQFHFGSELQPLRLVWELLAEACLGCYAVYSPSLRVSTWWYGKLQRDLSNVQCLSVLGFRQSCGRYKSYHTDT